MYEVAKFAGYLLSPLTLALGVWLLAGLCLVLRRRRLAVGLAAFAFAGLWIASMPLVARALAGNLESGYPAMTAQSAPSADAILVLGGALTGANPPKRPTFGLSSAAGRVWFAAELFRARKARWVVVAAGNQPGQESRQVEAGAIAEMLTTLGVPGSALRLENASRNTRENAANILPVLQSLGARRVLLVTSAQHMPRAVRTFAKVWGPNAGIVLIPMSTDVTAVDNEEAEFVWLPSLSALLSVSKSLKEFAGMMALTIM